MKGLIALLSRHGRFYIALGCGAVTVLAARALGFDAPLLAGGDIFYLVFLALCLVMISGQKTGDLKKQQSAHEVEFVVTVEGKHARLKARVKS